MSRLFGLLPEGYLRSRWSRYRARRAASIGITVTGVVSFVGLLIVWGAISVWNGIASHVLAVGHPHPVDAGIWSAVWLLASCSFGVISTVVAALRSASDRGRGGPGIFSGEVQHWQPSGTSPAEDAPQ